MLANDMKKIFAILIISSLIFSACARQPKYASAEKILLHYFQKYGKKYPDTIYGKFKAKKVEVTGIKEIHKNLIDAQAFLTLEGSELQRIDATMERKHIIWRVISWEKM